MRASSITRHTAALSVVWLTLVGASLAAGNLVANEDLGERLVRCALWPLPMITYGLSRFVDLFGDAGGAEPASSRLTRGEVTALGVLAATIYLAMIVTVANVAARLTLRR